MFNKNLFRGILIFSFVITVTLFVHDYLYDLPHHPDSVAMILVVGLIYFILCVILLSILAILLKGILWLTGRIKKVAST